MAETNIKKLQILVAQQNDQIAFKQLYETYYKELFRFATTFLNKKVLVEEVLQDVFTKIWLNRASLTEVLNLRVYLFKCVKNKCLDYLEKENIFDYFELEEVDIKMGHLSRSPEDIMISVETLTQINHIVQGLPPKCKMVFQLVKEENLKYREVAEILNISLKTVENHIGIALKRIGETINFNLRENK